MGCCGNKTRNLEWEVTFRDGSKERFPTSMEARLASQRDDSASPDGLKRAPTVKAVAKAASS